MTDDPNSAQPGWYPRPDHGMQYWDGQKWLDLPDPSPKHPLRWKNLIRHPIGVMLAVLLVTVIGVSVAVRLSRDADNRADVAAAQLSASESSAARAAAAEKADRERREDSERAMRRLSITHVENSIREMATGHANSSIIDGPVLSVSCSPVAGGSVDDLLAQTTVLECFAATEENPNGSKRGYKYHATMNWETETFTYGFGEP
ncbi:DUF2510 domain-containing protein [Rhodococcus sp. NPDC060084]|uniref:DUF2510 domain-containing protein n=1 Tax=Rhodococcus sp. NPDC060084 TaxID=3347053 RepID=UPI0036589836